MTDKIPESSVKTIVWALKANLILDNKKSYNNSACIPDGKIGHTEEYLDISKYTQEEKDKYHTILAGVVENVEEKDLILGESIHKLAEGKLFKQNDINKKMHFIRRLIIREKDEKYYFFAWEGFFIRADEIDENHDLVRIFKEKQKQHEEDAKDILQSDGTIKQVFAKIREKKILFRGEIAKTHNNILYYNCYHIFSMGNFLNKAFDTIKSIISIYGLKTESKGEIAYKEFNKYLIKYKGEEINKDKFLCLCKDVGINIGDINRFDNNSTLLHINQSPYLTVLSYAYNASSNKREPFLLNILFISSDDISIITRPLSFNKNLSGFDKITK
ncbi:MAG: hypothetical protein SVZ03_11535 [Spirochaetota bacterium]|nr:hypothetical protein [Spirochaetota bacterium]